MTRRGPTASNFTAMPGPLDPTHLRGRATAERQGGLSAWGPHPPRWPRGVTPSRRQSEFLPDGCAMSSSCRRLRLPPRHRPASTLRPSLLSPGWRWWRTTPATGTSGATFSFPGSERARLPTSAHLPPSPGADLFLRASVAACGA
jgi:hypothetical protein